jgi:hypothetical protein
MLKKSLTIAFGGAAISILFLGCASHAPVTTNANEVQTVMDAQYTSKNDVKAMGGDEADTIYKNYVSNIGKPVKPTSSLSESNTR